MAARPVSAGAAYQRDKCVVTGKRIKTFCATNPVTRTSNPNRLRTNRIEIQITEERKNATNGYSSPKFGTENRMTTAIAASHSLRSTSRRRKSTKKTSSAVRVQANM